MDPHPGTLIYGGRWMACANMPQLRPPAPGRGEPCTRYPVSQPFATTCQPSGLGRHTHIHGQAKERHRAVALPSAWVSWSGERSKCGWIGRRLRVAGELAPSSKLLMGCQVSCLRFCRCRPARCSWGRFAASSWQSTLTISPGLRTGASGAQRKGRHRRHSPSTKLFLRRDGFPDNFAGCR